MKEKSSFFEVAKHLLAQVIEKVRYYETGITEKKNWKQLRTNTDY